MSSTGQYYGWDLLMKTIRNDIKDETDLIVALIHWYLTKNAYFRCLGVGDDKTLKPGDEDSELLPEDWNNFKDKYTLRYRFENDLYILFASKTEFAVLLNLLNCKTMEVSNLSLSPKRVVSSTKGSLTQAIPKVSEILNRINYELIEPVFKGNTKEMETQTRTDYLQPQSEAKRGKQTFTSIIHPTSGPRHGNSSYGRQDLDPLGRFHGEPLNPFGIPHRPRRYLEPNFVMFAPPDVPHSRNFEPRSDYEDYFM